MKDMVENFTGFYNAFFEFSARSAYRIVKEKNAAMDIAQEVFLYFLKNQETLDFSDEAKLRAKIGWKTGRYVLIIWSGPVTNMKCVLSMMRTMVPIS